MNDLVNHAANTIVTRHSDFAWQARLFVIYARVHPDRATPLLTVLRQCESTTQELWQRYDMAELEAVAQGYKTASRVIQ